MFIPQAEDEEVLLWATQAAQGGGSGRMKLESTQQNGPAYNEGHTHAKSSSQLFNTHS